MTEATGAKVLTGKPRNKLNTPVYALASALFALQIPTAYTQEKQTPVAETPAEGAMRLFGMIRDRQLPLLTSGSIHGADGERVERVLFTVPTTTEDGGREITRIIIDRILPDSEGEEGIHIEMCNRFTWIPNGNDILPFGDCSVQATRYYSFTDKGPRGPEGRLDSGDSRTIQDGVLTVNTHIATTDGEGNRNQLNTDYENILRRINAQLEQPMPVAPTRNAPPLASGRAA